MHTLAIQINSGKYWNPQEIRNAYNCFVARTVRNISLGTYKTKVGNKIHACNVKRMGDQELIANCLNVVLHGTITNNIGLNELYTIHGDNINANTSTKFHRLINTVHDMFNETSLKSFERSFYLYLFATLKELYDSGLEVKKSEYSKFFTKMVEKWGHLNMNTETLYYSFSKNQSYTWKNAMSSIRFEYGQKVAVLLGFVYENLMDCLINLPGKRTVQIGLNSRTRYDLWVRDKGMVRVNGFQNGKWYNPLDVETEYVYYKLSDVLKNPEVSVDHIESLAGPNRGSDDISNMELTIIGYNRWKSAKV